MCKIYIKLYLFYKKNQVPEGTWYILYVQTSQNLLQLKSVGDNRVLFDYHNSVFNGIKRVVGWF